MIENLSPFSADLVPSFDAKGHAQTIIIVKGTFDLRGGLRPPSKAAPIWTGDVYFDGAEYPEYTVRFEADWAPAKPLTDVIVNGHAYAPTGRPASHVDVGVQVSGARPVLARVFGPRYWSKRSGWALSSAQPALRMPLASWMPMVDALTNGGALQPASPVEWLDESSLTPDMQAVPAGFGTFSRIWLPRRKYAGSSAPSGRNLSAGLDGGMPPDFDERYWNCAHPKLQYARESLQTGTEIRLVNMHHQGDVHVVLPSVPLAISSHATGRIEPELDTVIIEPDEDQLILIWRHAVARTPMARMGLVAVHLSTD